MEDDRETVRLWRVNRTIHELVRDRGYQVADDEINIDLETFKSEHAPTGGSVDRTKLNFFTEHSQYSNQRLFVFYSMERNVGVKTMRQFISIMEERDIQRGIIIWADKMTSAARKVIDAMRGTFHLEDFEEAFLTRTFGSGVTGKPGVTFAKEIVRIMLGTHYKKTIEKLNNYIDKVNKDLLHPVGLALVNPVKTAFLFIEVEYY
uniref:Probable 25 kD subunit of DNA-directed RNA polymerases I, II and III n=1 Tax=Melanopsichium pennsylvanicum 4 TaxID=1398559 RepID=A0A077QWJ8_9BASI|nr:probable 25 kD subunit of DNA-directed RNA polymerases I, II and III [Melanopsichium pennsylvanicum 4]